MTRWIVISILLVWAVWATKGCTDQYAQTSELEKAIAAAADSTRHYRDEASRLHGRRLMVIGSVATVDAVRPGLRDSAAKAAGVKKKDVKSVIAIGTVNSGTALGEQDTTHDQDGQSHLLLTYHDEWNHLTANYGTGVFTWEIRDSVVLSIIRKRVGLFRKEIVIDGYSINPHTNVAGLTGIQITDNATDVLTIDAYGGLRSMSGVQDIHAGFRANYFIGKRFSIEGGYQYNINHQGAYGELNFRGVLHLLKL